MRMNAIRAEVVGEDSQDGPTGPGGATPGKRPGVDRNAAWDSFERLVRETGQAISTELPGSIPQGLGAGVSARRTSREPG